MLVSVMRRVGVAVLAGGMAFGGTALTSASAFEHHGGHGGYHGGHGGYHGGGRYYGGGYRRHYYGYGYAPRPYYGGYGYYGRPGCLPVLGIVSGDFCNY